MNSNVNIEKFGVTVKQVTISNEIERISNHILSDNIGTIANADHKTKKPCQGKLPWNDESFWIDLNSSDKCKQSVVNKLKINQTKKLTERPFKVQIKDYYIPSRRKSYYKNLKSVPKFNHKRHNQHLASEEKCSPENIPKKYFETWKTFAKNKKERREYLNEQIEQKEKMDEFFKKLKAFQKNKLKRNNTAGTFRCTTEKARDIKSAPNESARNGEKVRSNALSSGSLYQNRFKAQQHIIQVQKQKLAQQEKVIQELQLGKLSEDIKQSIKDVHKEIQETFSKCSVKLKCKMPPLHINVEDNLIKFHVVSSKVPKIIQQMDTRAIERKERRQAIFEKKKTLDKQRKETVEMEIAKKKTLEEEERKRSLREIREKRQKELEHQQAIQKRKREYEGKCAKADGLRRKKLLKWGFNSFRILLFIKEENKFKCRQFRKLRLLRITWKQWCDFMEEIDRAKGSEAEQLYITKLKTMMLKQWINLCKERTQHIQVAEDLYDMRLQSRTFIYWHRHVCAQYILLHKKLDKAAQHYNRRLLIICLCKWTLFPTIKQFEKVKEEKKQRWREKVWEIIPDYVPVVDDLF